MTGEPPPNVLRLLREGHEERVLSALRAHGALTRSELGRHTNLSRATLSSIVRQLLSRRALVEVPSESEAARGRGRPVNLLTLNPAGGFAVGMDLGHRRIEVAVANVAHGIVASAGEDCAERTPWVHRVESAVRLLESATQRASVSLTALEGIGVGVVGPVSESGSHRHHRHASRIDLIRERLTSRCGVPVHIDNNTRLAALAEALWGAGAAVPNVLYLRLSYGVGGGLVLNGQLFSGADGGAGELGHVSVDPDGPRCHCGGRGCLERYVSLATLLERCHTRRFDHVLERLAAGDRRVREVIDDAGRKVGRVLAAACNVVNPEVVVIGGELAGAGEALLRPVRAGIQEAAHRQVRGRLRTEVAALGHEGAARGGIALVLRRSALLAGYPPTAPEPTPPATSSTGGTPMTSARSLP